MTKQKEDPHGIAKKKTFDKEKHLEKWLKNWLKGRTITKTGHNYRDRTEKQNEAEIIRVERQYKLENGRADLAIFHNQLDLAWNHRLANPFLIELKNSGIRNAAAQAVKYKEQPEEKYPEERGRPTLRTVIASTESLSKGLIAAQDTESAKFAAKRIYWKLGIGVMQSSQPNKAKITFNEGDKVLIN